MSLIVRIRLVLCLFESVFSQIAESESLDQLPMITSQLSLLLTRMGKFGYSKVAAERKLIALMTSKTRNLKRGIKRQDFDIYIVWQIVVELRQVMIKLQGKLLKRLEVGVSYRVLRSASSKPK